MKIIFFGTPDYVIPVLEKLHKYHEIVAVVTQSPKPVGRDKKVTYSAVDSWAYKKHIPRNFDYVDLPEADMGVCASFGMIIPQSIINKFKYGVLVVHPSLLPQFRWSNPIRATLITGTNPTGVSIIKMNNKWDEGPILTQFKEEVYENDDNESLRNRLFQKAADVLVEMIPAYVEGKIKLKKQNDKNASYAKMITKNDAYIPPEYLKNAMEINNVKDKWDIPFIKNYSVIPDANTIHRFIKAMSFWPVAWTKIEIKGQEKRIKLIKSHINEESGYLELDEVQLEGKNPTSWKLFKGSYGIEGF